MVLLAVFGQTSVWSQETEEEQVETLNPFVVDESATMGYYATETLSGTQLRTEVRNLANPITILTEEFMQDIGAVNYEEAVEFLPSTRTYVGDTQDNDANAQRTGTPFNVRGFRVETLTNNFFATQIRVDTYNTERLTQSRGPNSLLFGLGSVGGALDTTAKMGKFNRNSYEMGLRFDSEGSARANLDANVIVVKDKLAVRVAGLSEDRRTYRELEYHRRNSGYINFTLQPWKGAVINLNAEGGRIDDLTPRPYLTRDIMSGWLNDARAPFDKANKIDLNLVATGNNNARNTARNILPGVSVGLNTTNYLVFVENDPTMGIQNWKFKSRSSSVRINGFDQDEASLTDPAAVVPGGVDYPVFTVPGGPADHFERDYTKFGGSWQQQIFEKTYIEIAGAYETSSSDDWQPLRRQDIELNLDVNYYLPTQRIADNPTPTLPLNPYFGMPYLESNPWFLLTDNEDTQFRATLTHQFDFRGFEPVKGFDFGRMTLVGFYYFHDKKTLLQQKEELTSISVMANGDLSNTQNRILRRYYLTPGQPPYFPYKDRELMGINQAANPAVPANVIPAVSTFFGNRLSPVYAPEETHSWAGLGQWELFSRRLILTGGYRKDDVSRRNFLFATKPVTNLFGDFGEGTWEPAEESPIENTNFGAVLKVTNWLDVFANSSTNTVSAGGQVYSIYNEQIPDQEGEGFDYGFRTFLWNNKLILKYNYFENDLKNRISNPLRDNTIGIPMARENGYTEQFLEGMTFNGYGNLVAGAVRFRDFPGIGLWSDVEDDITKGHEIEATINPTENLRLSVNVSYNEATLQKTYITLTPWYEEFVAPVRDNTAITSLVANPTINPTRTIGDLITGIERRLTYHNAQVGGQRTRTNKWLVNFVSSYSFDRESKLRGLRVGGNVRYREAPAIGYPEVNGDFDVDNAFYGLDVFFVDVFASYGRKLDWFKNGTWELTLRVRNLNNDDGWYPTTAVDDGTGQPFYQQQIAQAPRTFELSALVRF